FKLLFLAHLHASNFLFTTLYFQHDSRRNATQIRKGNSAYSGLYFHLLILKKSGIFNATLYLN
ncbi:hypothetical protein, partial [Vibrio cyclitrophicus]